MKKKVWRDSLFVAELLRTKKITVSQFLGIFNNYLRVLNGTTYDYNIKTTIDERIIVQSELGVFKFNTDNIGKKDKKLFKKFNINFAYVLITHDDSPHIYITENGISLSRRIKLYHLLMELKQLVPDYRIKLEMLLVENIL